MKLSTRLGFVVGFAALGCVILVLFALLILRETMLSDRHAQITQTLNMTVRQMKLFVEQEKSGSLSREEAQARAKQAASGLRHGGDYVIVRDTSGMLLVFPDPKRVGKVDLGAKAPDGRTTHQIYLDALEKKDLAVVDIMAPRPGTSEAVPKLIGVAKLAEWNWIVGFGLFVDDIDAVYRTNGIRFALIAIVVIVIVMLAALVMARKIYRALGGEPEYAVAMAKAIAAGNLTQTIETSGVPGSLMASIQLMQKSLHDMIGSIQENADRVGITSSQLTQQMEQIDVASQRSGEAVSEVATAIGDMAISVDRISQSARKTESNAVVASQLAEDGVLLVNDANREFCRAAQQVDQASGMIGGLVERSHEIGGIARVIKEIADQTNLLALNAAIEAARAGEQGRGFAVVADEVRKLAERTSKATDQITGMITAINQDTANVVGGMRAVGPQVAAGVDIISKAETSLRQISEAADVAKNNVSEVATATSEQSTAGSGVKKNVEQISRMIESSVSSVRQAEDNVLALQQLARELRTSIAHFRI